MKREESIFNFHTACMEQACGGSLDQVSALYWDQNEEYPQFAGSTFRACDGLSKVMAILARQLNTKFRHEVIIKIIIHSVIYLFLRDNYRWHSTTLKVVKVDYSGPKVAVTLSNGAQLTCDQVIVAVPLSVLKKDVIEFSPLLPEKKQEAIKTLGEGLLEKVKKKHLKLIMFEFFYLKIVFIHIFQVCLKFPRRFWESKVKNGDSFGHIPSSFETRGDFVVFYDTTHPKQVLLKSLLNLSLLIFKYFGLFASILLSLKWIFLRH